MSGLWGSPTGTVYSPGQGDLLFIPQKPYMALGSLREQLCYPLDQARFSDEQLRAVLDQVMLGKLLQRYPDLDIKQDWPRLLSLGEQQRLAFARLLLNSPKVVVLKNRVMEVLQGWPVAHADERHLTIPQQGIKAGFGLNIEGTGGFIQHHDLGRIEQQPRKGQSLLFTQREQPRPVLLDVEVGIALQKLSLIHI